MLISKHALEQVAQAYFDCLWEQEFYGLAGERLEGMKQRRLAHFDETKLCYWFRFLPALNAAIEMGEDISFCFLAKRYCNIPVYADTSIQPGHIGQYAFRIQDFLPYRDECILRAKVNGSYKMEVPAMPISILCPTRGRPENMKRLLASVLATSEILPEIVFYIDQDDGPSLECMKEIGAERIRCVVGKRITLSEMWNRAAEAATGEILMHAGDDIVFKTQGWDHQVRRAFAAFPDRLIFVHGDDGYWGMKFGTHGFLHRAWMDAAGYFCPPYFSSDYNDTWFNEVFNALNRRICLPFVTEHLHPVSGKAELDQTHKERLARHKRDNVEKLYQDLAPERAADVDKVRALLGKAYELSRQVCV